MSEQAMAPSTPLQTSCKCSRKPMSPAPSRKNARGFGRRLVEPGLF
jgi:hypothetical protein